MLKTHMKLLIPLLLFACKNPDPPAPKLVPTPPQPVRACTGGLLCEADEPFDGWRVPQFCHPRRIGQRIATCWLEANGGSNAADWAHVQEFFQTRYAHAALTDVQLRISGQTAQVPIGPTPPLLVAHQRLAGVELVFLAGDAVDTSGARTETAGPAASPSLPPSARGLP